MPSTPRRIRHTRRRGFSTRSVGSLLLLRFLLIANALTLMAIGALYLAYGARPDGLIVGGVLIGTSLLLLCCVRLTDPYRHTRRRSARGQ